MILTTIIDFEDGGLEGQIMHKGDRKSCEELMKLIPAIAYSGHRKIKNPR